MVASALTLAFSVSSALFAVGATVVLNTRLDLHNALTILFQISPELGSCW